MGYYCFALCIILILYEEISLGFSTDALVDKLPQLIDIIRVYSYFGLIAHFWVQTYLLLGWFDFTLPYKCDMYNKKRLPVFIIWAIAMIYSCAMIVLMFFGFFNQFDENLFDSCLFGIICVNLVYIIISLIICIFAFCRLCFKPIHKKTLYTDAKFEQKIWTCWKNVPRFIYASILCNIFIIPQCSVCSIYNYTLNILYFFCFWIFLF